MMFNKFIYDYARGPKNILVNHTKEYKKGYSEIVLRETKGCPFACFTASVEEDTDKYYIGISVCHSRLSTFSKSRGKEEARDRLQYTETEFKDFLDTMPRKVVKSLYSFLDRCEKYYGDKVPAYEYRQIMDYLYNKN